MYIYIYTHVYIYIYIYTHMYVYTYIHTNMHIYVYTYVRVCVCSRPGCPPADRTPPASSGAVGRGARIYLRVYVCIYEHV